MIKIYSFRLFNGFIRFYCKYDGKKYFKCPINENGLCKTKYLIFPQLLLKDLDKKKFNYIKCLCV